MVNCNRAIGKLAHVVNSLLKDCFGITIYLFHSYLRISNTIILLPINTPNFIDLLSRRVLVAREAHFPNA